MKRKTKQITPSAALRWNCLHRPPPTPFYIFIYGLVYVSRNLLLSPNPRCISRSSVFVFLVLLQPPLQPLLRVARFFFSSFPSFFVVENPDFKQVVLPVIWLLTPLLARPIYALVLFQIPEVDRRIAFVKCDAQYFSRHVYLPLSFFFKVRAFKLSILFCFLHLRAYVCVCFNF